MIDIPRNDPAFPYRPPSDSLKREFAHVFNLESPVRIPLGKRLFDIAFSLPIALLSLPILLAIKIAYLIEGIIDQSAKGPMLYYYYARSGGQRIKKYKLRVIKEKHIDQALAAKHDWLAYRGEWGPECRTKVGTFVKNYYLDELPQFFSILAGDMTLVGPRPISDLHYGWDLEQGNVSRKLVTGGLLGFGHIRKGTEEFGDPRFEYEYIDILMNSSTWQILSTDVWVMWKGLSVVLRGEGL